jgi:hypothetical protein
LYKVGDAENKCKCLTRAGIPCVPTVAQAIEYVHVIPPRLIKKMGHGVALSCSIIEKYNEQKPPLNRSKAVVKASIYSRKEKLGRKATTSENAVVRIIAMTACVYIRSRHF